MPTTTGIATEFIQFTRASNATVTDSDGKVKWAPHNLLTNSESFDAASWTKAASSVTANSTAAPNGTTTADTLASANSSSTFVGAYVTMSIAAGHTMSAFVKAGTSNIAWISGDAGQSYGVFSLSGSGSVLTSSNGTASIASVGNSWFLITVANTTVTNSYVIVGGKDTYTSGNPWGNGTWTSGNTIFVWGASLYRSDLGGMQPNTSAYPLYNPTTPKNLLGYSEDWTGSTWNNTTATTVVSNIAIATNGLQTADLIYPSSSGSTRQRYQSVTGQVLGRLCTVSIYLKSSSMQWVAMLSPAGDNFGCYFDIINNVKGTEASGVTGSITSLGNGWYRCSVSQVLSATTAYIGVSFADANGGTTVTASGTSGVLAWGAQLSDSASLDSYVPVYGAAVTSAAYYGPRRDFDGATLACKGLLVEEQRTNLLLYSTDFTQSAWSKVNATIPAATAPDGTSTAVTLTGTGAGGTLLRQDTAVSSATVDVSYYVKAGTATTCVIGDVNIGAVGIFNLSNGTVSSGSGATISNAGNEWYRCSVTYTAVGGFARQAINPGSTFSGTTTSSIVVWGAQCELGSFATSYIPTGSASATRNADVASVSTQAFPYSSSESTIVASASPIGPGGSAAGSAVFSLKGASGNGLLLYQPATTYSLVAYVDASNVTLGTSSFGAIEKLAIAYNGVSNGAVRNGGTVSSVGTTVATAADSFYFGNIAAAYVFNGHIRQITYLPRRISNAELITRTS